MNTEITISRAAADNIAGLIEEYFTQNGAGFDDAALAEALDAICNADCILIDGE